MPEVITVVQTNMTVVNSTTVEVVETPSSATIVQAAVSGPQGPAGPSGSSGPGAGTGDVSSNTATSVDGELPVFNGTTGKSLKRMTGSGVVKVVSGVASPTATLNDLGTPTADFSIGSHKLTNVLDPTTAQDAATKAYADTIKARSAHTGTQLAATISDFSAAADARVAAAAGVSVASLSGGKIPTSQIPALALVSVQTAASQAAQLALTTQEGDVVVRTDTSVTYMRNSGVSGTMTDFTLLNTPADVVTSVNGQTGIVSLAKSDVGLGNVDNTSDTNKPVSTAQAAADALKADKVSITAATKTKVTYNAQGIVTAGADATQDDIGDGTTNKQYSATDKTKLAGIAAGATANDTDANLKSRSNHTGTQLAATISDFLPAMTYKARKTFYAYDDFINNINSSVFLGTAGGTGTVSSVAIDADSTVGICRLNTGAGASDRAGQWSSQNNVLIFSTGATWTFESRVRINTNLSTSTERFQIMSGFLDNSTAESSDGAYFSYRDDLNSGKWELVTSTANTRTRTDSTITVAADTWYVLKVVVLSVSGTLTARFYINDVQVGGDITANLPSGAAARATGYGTHLLKSVGTTGRNTDLDYMEVSGVFAANR